VHRNVHKNGSFFSLNRGRALIAHISFFKHGYIQTFLRKKKYVEENVLSIRTRLVDKSPPRGLRASKVYYKGLANRTRLWVHGNRRKALVEQFKYEGNLGTQTGRLNYFYYT
jgi:hypothetical protein